MQKNIYLMIIGITLGCGANAATMCSALDSVTVVLDPNVAGSGYTRDENLKTWQATFSYGKISGIASCNSIAGSGTGKVNTQDTMSQTDEGQYCWCKMLAPAVSAWVFNRDNSSASHCASYCAYYCGNAAQSYSAFRQGLFRSAGI